MYASQRLNNFILFGCIFLFVGTEVLLSPFYPQFFEKVFGIEDLSFTGMYVFLCRLTVVLISPIWGLLAKRFDARKLLLIGQVGTAFACVLMAVSQTEQQFLIFSICLLFFKSSYILLYTILIQQAGKAKKRVTGLYHAVFQSSVIVATLASGWVIQLEDPLIVFWWAAALDALQAIVCFLVFKRMRAYAEVAKEPEVLGKRVVGFGFLMKMALIIFTLHFSVTLVRPFFTLFSERELHTSVFSSSLLFLMPSIMAVAAAPMIVKCRPDKIPSLYKIAGMILGASLLFQGVVTSMPLFVVFRCLFGLALAICQASLEIVLFQRGGNVHYQYGIMSAFQNMGLLLAPLAATFLVENYTLQHPFLYASVAIAVHLALVFLTIYSRSGVQEEKRIIAEQEKRRYVG
ncbi:MFS transporter [Pseudalkalibacillus salsuginis]|uniref:MFS transporter n=1 Tax=Pseudalkalibacillus salsuginis TaxID=2910972 RepID=UPI001F2BD45E|nr:MFS transporter [Pseudalkalibacillus salsuginis]MCF6409367.1 MFS transporter [Pseudalkalibacillus salsuginis]